MSERLHVPMLTTRQLERRADALLDACVARGRSIGPPVQVEWIAEHLLDLAILWDALPTDRDAPVLGGLDPLRGEIVLNEREIHRFRTFPGQEAFTLAHEVGHWLLHVPPAHRRQPALPGFAGARACRAAPRGAVCGAGTGAAAKQRERQADRFASLLLLPARLLLPRCAGLDLTRFPARYRLRDEFGVSITAMNLRLKALGFGWFNERDEYVPGRDLTPRSPSLEAKGENAQTRVTPSSPRPITGEGLVGVNAWGPAEGACNGTNKAQPLGVAVRPQLPLPASL